MTPAEAIRTAIAVIAQPRASSSGHEFDLALALIAASSGRTTPEEIQEQRTRGWPDFHPEDFCHLCGDRNCSWSASREDWLAATSQWAAETGREGICCLRCFQEMHERATGKKTVWCVVGHEERARMEERERMLREVLEEALDTLDGARDWDTPDGAHPLSAEMRRAL